MAERRENSVLFSLRELRQIEDERVKQEADAEQARADAEKRAKDDAERAAREALEKKARDEAERLRKIQEDKERQVREEQMRLEEAKHRAEVEAQMKLEEARLHAEAQAAAASKKGTPMGVIAGVGVALLLAVGALAYVLLVYIPQRDMAAEKRREDQIADIKKQFKSQQEAFDAEAAKLRDQLAKTNDAAEKAKIEAEIAATTARKAEAIETAKKELGKVQVAAPRKPTGGASPATKTGGKGSSGKPNCDPDKDPLCGSGL